MKKVFDDRIEWLVDGKRHREGGPAIEWKDGAKHWYQNGKLHRLEGPAIELRDGTKYWCQNNYLHRLDGPAVEYSDGVKSWYINGKQYSDEAWFNLLTEDGKLNYILKGEK